MLKNPMFISIVGQTATGKTDKAFAIAEAWSKDNKDSSVIVISADSKQIYQDLEVLSGADVPTNFKKNNINQSFNHPNLPIYLYGTSFLRGNEEWSVGHFHYLVKDLIKNNPHSLFILVGGTGLYHQQIYNPAETIHVKPNLELRKTLENKNLAELQLILANKNADKFENMNNSDKNNPRRLIRAIEVADLGIKPEKFSELEPLLQIGLTTTNIEEKIKQRVHKRLEQGVITEVKDFEKKYPAKDLQAKSTLGYQEILKFINQEINQEELINLWTLAEIQYARRQMTWWKKRENIQWFEADKVSINQILNLIT